MLVNFVLEQLPGGLVHAANFHFEDQRVAVIVVGQPARADLPFR